MAGLAVLRPANAFALPGVDTYDDGNRDVPDGVAGDPTRVIVVGAGFAGLAAANALRNAGIDCVVLEGRTRLGGRAWTHDVAGHPFDLGCSWIHDPVTNPMAQLATRAGVLQTPASFDLDAPTFRFFDARSGEVPTAEAAQVYVRYLDFDDKAQSISDELGPRASMRDGIVRYLDDQGLTGNPRRWTEFFLRTTTEFPDATDWRKLSLRWAAAYEAPYYGVGQGNFPLGGYRKIVDAIGAGSDVRFGHRVTRIASDRSGVTVTAEATARGERRTWTLRGSHVIVTLPLGVLKAGHVAFAPGLPVRKRQAIQRLGFGRFEKIVMVFDSAFWENDGRTDIFYASDRTPGEFPLFLDYHKLNLAPALVGFTCATFAEKLVALDKTEIAARARSVLQRILGSDVPTPVEVAVTRWGVDPFSLGSYSSLWLGSGPDDQSALASPVDGRVLFAGEATSRERYGYADGALSTGIREAKRLLRQAMVELTA